MHLIAEKLHFQLHPRAVVYAFLIPSAPVFFPVKLSAYTFYGSR